MATVGGSGDTSLNRASDFSLPPTGVLSRSVTLPCQRRLFTFSVCSNSCHISWECKRTISTVNRFTVSRFAGRVSAADSEGSGLKYKVKVLLRSQSKLIPSLLAYSRLAYGDTKWRSMSIRDGAVQESKALELTLICVINQLAVTAELTWVAAS